MFYQIFMKTYNYDLYESLLLKLFFFFLTIEYILSFYYYFYIQRMYFNKTLQNLPPQAATYSTYREIRIRMFLKTLRR